MDYTVIFQPSGRRGKIKAGKTLLEASHELGVDIESVCGAKGTCAKCKVKIEEGFFEKFGIDSRLSHLSPLTEVEKQKLKEEELADNYRLACLATVQGDVLVYVPEESRGAQQVILETGKQRAINLNPAVRKYYIEMPAATLHDFRDDFQRLRETLHEQHGLPLDLGIDYYVLRELPLIVREADWKVTVTVWLEREIIKVEPGLVEHAYGVAVDVGSTTVAAYLCDLKRGTTVTRKSMMNPQVRYGEDILSRVTYAMMNEDGLERLHKAIVTGVNSLIKQMTAEVGATPEDILEITLVGNTIMHHLLCNFDPKFVGRAPFAPVIRQSLNVKARDLGLKITPAGNAHILPIEAGYVGADNMAVIIAEEPYKEEEKIRLVIDIGTNGEIVLGNRQRLLSTSCATGPALEGAQLRFGMRAAPGAIEKVRIDPVTREVKYKVIGIDAWYPEVTKTEAKGICGSGIIDAIAEMFKAGILLPSGRLNTKLNTPRLRRGADGKPEFVIAWADETSIGQDITITQGDVRAVQLAKAALYVGARYLMEKLGVDHVDSITLAGAFGSYIDRESAMVMGMIPDCDLEKVQAVGNAAGDGAQIALYDRDKRQEADRIARWVEFVETAVEPDFQERFAAAMAFPHSQHEFPHIRSILDAIPKEEGRTATAAS